MTKIIIMIILANIAITIKSGPYDQNFKWMVYLKIAIYMSNLIKKNKKKITLHGKN